MKATSSRPRSRRDRSDLPIIGWREWVGLPELGTPKIKAKVDTGARSSSLHAWDIEPFRKRGAEWVRFVLHPEQRSTKKTVRAEAPVLDRRKVKSSSGESEERYVIETEVELLDQCWPIEVTLTRRDEMGFRMLLGRQAIRGRFLVDSGHSYNGGKPRKKVQPSKKKKPSR